MTSFFFLDRESLGLDSGWIGKVQECPLLICGWCRTAAEKGRWQGGGCGWYDFEAQGVGCFVAFSPGPYS